jgi:hypothetical protein
LKDPVAVEGKPVLPKGTLVEGHLETIPARRMMRRGPLRMAFHRIKLPDGTVQPARFELSSTESDSAKTDRGNRPSHREQETFGNSTEWYGSGGKAG